MPPSRITISCLCPLLRVHHHHHHHHHHRHLCLSVIKINKTDQIRSGAILSVPLLGVTKLLLDEADHPLAKVVLHVIRADNSIDEGLERTRTGGLANINTMVLMGSL